MARWSRVAWSWLASGIALGATFVVAMAIGIVGHLDHPAVRRLVATELGNALSRTLAGHVRVEQIGHLGLSSVRHVNVHVRDPDGVSVLRALDLEIQLELVPLLRSLAKGDTVLVRLPLVSVREGEVCLDADTAGRLRLARAVSPRNPSEPTEGPGIELDADALRVGHLHLGGRPPGAPMIDADVLDLRAAARTDPLRTHVTLDRVGIVARSLPHGLDPEGILRGELDAPSNQGSKLRASFDGAVGGAATELAIRLDDRTLDARLDVIDQPGEGALRLGPAVEHGDQALSLHAEASGTLPSLTSRVRLQLGDARAAIDARLNVGDAPAVDATMRVRDLDLAAIREGLPPSRLGWDAAAKVRLEGKARAPTGHASGRFVPSRLADVDLPAIDFSGSLHDQQGHLHVRVGGDVMPTEVLVEVAPRPGGQRADVALRSRIDELQRVPWIGQRARGSAAVDASVGLLLPEMHAEMADVRVDGANIDAGGIRTRELHATARGGREPISLSVRARDLALAGTTIDALGIDANGVVVDRGGVRVDRAAACVTASAGALRADVDGARLVGPWSAGSWRRALGRVSFQGEVDLAAALFRVPVERVPLADLRGQLVARGSLERRAIDGTASFAIHASTRGLVVAGPPGEPRREATLEIVGPSSWRSTGVDLGLDVRADSKSGLANVAARAWDAHGALVSFDAKAIVPFDAITARALVEAPLNVTAAMPPRSIDALPSIFGARRVPGVVEARIDMTGSIDHPRVHLAAEGRRIRAPTALGALETNVALAATYDGRAADTALAVDAHGARLLAAVAHVDANVRDFVLSHGTRAWQAHADLHAFGFPLELVPFLADQHVRGRASGEAHLVGLHRDARALANVDLEDLRLGEVTFPSGTLTVDARERSIRGSLRMNQTDGLVDVSSTAGITWGDRLVPALDATRPIDAKLVSVGFRAAALTPLVAGAIPELDGRIDADVTAHVLPQSGRAELDGAAHIRNGRAHVAALGADLVGIQADAALTPDGKIHLANVFARNGQGELRADVRAQLDGLQLAEAKARLRVPERRPLDVTVEGIPLGEMSGTVDATLRRSADETSVDVDVPRLAVVLPRQTKTGVQTLGRRDDIRVGVYQSGRRFEVLPLFRGDRGTKTEASSEPMRMSVNVNLRDVTLSRGNELRAWVMGRPRIEIENGEERLFGQLSIQRGWLDVQGKRFTIEKGVVTFDGQTPPDPVVLATAAWTAADGTRVFADFLGPASTGKVTLRSEPTRPKNEILALVLFGSADGVNPPPARPGPQTSGTTRAALGLGGAVAAQGLTDALDSLTGVQTVARIDTTQANNPRPEIEFEISPRVTVGFAHVLGTPPITEPDKNLASFEYRFHKNWSVETVFGDRGTVLADTLWQKRY